MGFELRREIRDLLPRGGVLTDKECRLILELADNANDQTRRAWPGVDWLADVCDIPNPKRVGEFLTSIARKWVELRVEIGKDRHGKPYFAKSGHRTVYRFPTRDELVEILGEDQVPPAPGLDARKDPAKQGPQVPAKEGPQVPPLEGAQVPAKGGPFSSGSPQSSSSKISSSLSPREDDTSPSSDVELEPGRERDIETPSEQPKNPNPLKTAADYLLAAGCPEELLTDMEAELRRRNNVRAPGASWFRQVHRNEELADHVADAIPDFQPAITEPQRAAAHPFVEPSDGSPSCASCGFPKANGRHRVGNQGGGYVSPRVNLADNNTRRSTAAVRAEQGLRVADDLDRENGHGRYAREIRSPADRVVADAVVLHAKYKRQESGHRPWQNYPDPSVYEEDRPA